VVLSIPKILRRHFLYDRKLLSDLSRCGWKALKAFYTTGVRDQKAVCGAVVAIRTFRDYLAFHPHLHVLVSEQIKVSKPLKPAITIYLIFIMASSRTHILTAGARFSDSSKSRFHSFLKLIFERYLYKMLNKLIFVAKIIIVGYFFGAGQINIFKTNFEKNIIY
jgi:hypothetical protein|tara:strand:+ start:30004 stop:30495 length:492 start_codon:yes stop_codon:yes gene_type:complete